MLHAAVEGGWQLKLVIPAEFLNVVGEIISSVNVQKTLNKYSIVYWGYFRVYWFSLLSFLLQIVMYCEDTLSVSLLGIIYLFTSLCSL